MSVPDWRVDAMQQVIVLAIVRNDWEPGATMAALDAGVGDYVREIRALSIELERMGVAMAVGDSGSIVKEWILKQPHDQRRALRDVILIYAANAADSPLRESEEVVRMVEQLQERNEGLKEAMLQGRKARKNQRTVAKRKATIAQKKALAESAT